MNSFTLDTAVEELDPIVSRYRIDSDEDFYATKSAVMNNINGVRHSMNDIPKLNLFYLENEVSRDIIPKSLFNLTNKHSKNPGSVPHIHELVDSYISAYDKAFDYFRDKI